MMHRQQILTENRGAVVIMTGLCMVMLMGFAALVIDIGFGLVTKNQLHNVADAGSLAGTSQLGRIYGKYSITP